MVKRVEPKIFVTPIRENNLKDSNFNTEILDRVMLLPQSSSK